MTDATNSSGLKNDPRLDPFFTSEDERKAITKAMFDESAEDYDHAEKLTGFGSGTWYRREVLRRNGLTTGMTLLDVAAGTGLVAVEGKGLIGQNGRLIALDPSPGMLNVLRKKIDAETIEAYAESIPLPDNEVDFISMGYALRHVGDIDKVFNEYYRVLRKGGRTCILEISRPKNGFAQFLLRSYIGTIIPLISKLTCKSNKVEQLWKYYGETIQAAVNPEPILEAMRRAGFVDVHCEVTFGIFREYIGKKA